MEKRNNDKYVLQHDRPNCIGCGACAAVAPDFWEMAEDGKSKLKGAKKINNDWWELEIGKKDFQANKDAADSCPVNVIHIIKKDAKEKII